VARHSAETRRRLAQTASRLRSLVHPEAVPPDSLAVSERTGRAGWDAARALAYRPAKLGEEFGPQWATYWFQVGATVPEAWAGARVDLLWDGGSEATLWRAGEVVQGLYSGWRAQRSVAPVLESAAGGERVELAIEMACNSWAGDDPAPAAGVDPALVARYRLGRNWTEGGDAPGTRRAPCWARLEQCALARFDPVAWRLLWDFETLRRLEAEGGGGLEADWAGVLLSELNRFCNAWDASEVATWEPAGGILADLLARRGPRPRHRVLAVGHAHIDTAWVWPLAETRRKLVRTAANQLALMERYPEYRYAASSAQHYAWLEEDDPELFARVGERVDEGRWEVVGGAWVEPDCNLPSGESLVRQLLYGQRWFADRFGRQCAVYWSPDTFGHNGQLPQILRQCGIGLFVTQKLSWNQFTRPPHDTFRWRGIDGSEVIAHLPPVGTYNAELEPAELRRAVSEFRDHDRSDASLVLFGHGDGGGGPTPEMLERATRVADLRGLPLVEASSSERFFDAVEERAGELPTIVGQLYFEYHRGTYTSQSRTKLGNRAGERALHEAETAAAMAWARGLSAYPGDELNRLWPVLLRNQFHDVLAGTSLREVHAEAEAEQAAVVRDATGRRDEASAALAAARRGDGAPLNLDGFPRREVLELPDGELGVFDCPALGFGTRVEARDPVRLERDDVLRLANDRLIAELDRRGRLTSLRLASDGREALAGPGAMFELYEDRPTAFDAWELEPYHNQTRVESAGAESVAVTVDDPLRAEISFSHRIGEASELEQRVRLDAGSDRLEFRCRIDWRERHRILKVGFPLRAQSTTATFGAQFGVHELSTHRNTDADLARFEAPALGFVDLGEHRFGVALLSPTGYGFSALDQVLRLSLLRSPTDPDPDADQGDHELLFALAPHDGDWRAAGIVRAATTFGHPMPWVAGAAPSEAFARVDSPDLILDMIKRSEDGEALVMRLHEAHGGRGTARVRVAPGVASAVRANALEEPVARLECDPDAIVVPFGPFELITLRIELAAPPPG
jgi:alpha-mannosidase